MSKTIKSLYNYFSGYAFKSIDFSSDGIPLIRIGDINNAEVQFTESTAYLPEYFAVEYERFLVQKGDLLIGLSGASLGKFGIYMQEEKALVNQRILVLREKQDLKSSTQYLAYYLYILKKGIEDKAVGGAQPNISPEKILRLEVLHTFEDQLKIVGRLNKVQELIDKRVESIKLLNEYIKSVFLEMFLERSNQSDYIRLRESNGIISATYGTAKKANDEEIGLPVLRMSNITFNGDILLDDMKWVNLTVDEQNKLKLENRDVLFNRTNSPELVGKIAVWNKGSEYTYAGYLIKLELDESILNPYYLTSFFNSDFGKVVLKNKARLSGNLANISATTLLNQLFYLPSIQKQIQFENKYLKIEKQKEQCFLQLIDLRSLFQYELQEAFTLENQIDEYEVFESLLQTFTKQDLKKGDRIKYLLKWIDSKETRFSKFESYDLAWDRLRELLDDGSIEQVLDENQIKLKIVE